MKPSSVSRRLRHRDLFQKWMAADGYAVQTQKEYCYFIDRYCNTFQKEMNESTMTSESDVARVYRAVEDAESGTRGYGEFNLADLKKNLRPALRAYMRFVCDTFQIAEDVPIDELPRRLQMEISRIVRDTKAVKEVKFARKNKCQICGGTIQLPKGRFYSEGHHLKPLGRKHNGPDKKENILCVCPTCHVKLDFGALKIIPEKLRNIPEHAVGRKFIDYHNERCS